MPGLVSLFNGIGGTCAVLISIVKLNQLSYSLHHTDFAFAENRVVMYFPVGEHLIVLMSLIIGSISFAGSMMTWGKLKGSIGDITFKGQRLMNLLLLLIILFTAYIFFTRSFIQFLFIPILILSLLYGVLFVLPIGGSDVPVVISLLNSFTGVATVCGGFLYDNKAMLIGGILVGATGTLLAILMWKSMKRSLKNVMIGSLGGGSLVASAGSAGKEQGA